MKKIALKIEIILLCLAIISVSVLFLSCDNGVADNNSQSTGSTAAKTESTAASSENTTASTTAATTSTKAATTAVAAANSTQNVKNAAKERYLKLFKAVENDGTVTLKKSDISKGYLILVNGNHKYDSTQKQDFIEFESLDSRSFYVAYSGLEADRFTAQQFNGMNRQYLNKQGNKLTVCSSYRSIKKQMQLFNDSVARQGEKETLKWFTRPGHSEHHTGFAIDYNTDSFGSNAFTGKGKQAYVKEICADYGFILRYTAEKKDVTGVSAEAWHFRQVGIPHAEYIMKNGLCLEEYIDSVKSYSENNPLCINANGQIYYVFYVKSQGGSTKINLNGYDRYLSSGNNVDGFIITATKSGSVNHTTSASQTITAYQTTSTNQTTLTNQTTSTNQATSAPKITE